MYDGFLIDFGWILERFWRPKSSKIEKKTKLEGNAKKDASRKAKEAPMRGSNYPRTLGFGSREGVGEG